jgi:uncharacterized protein YihD (DUF1040 family)
MRDEARIGEILGLLNDIWEQDRDLRFFQLIFNLQAAFSKKNGGIGRVEETDRDQLAKVGFDLFNVEDEAVIKFLADYIKKQDTAAAPHKLLPGDAD